MLTILTATVLNACTRVCFLHMLSYLALHLLFLHDLLVLFVALHKEACVFLFYYDQII